MGKLVGIIFLIVVLVTISGIIVFLSISHPERRLDVGANIESIEINGNLADIVLSGGANDKEIERVKFIFTDNKGVKHYYSTTEGIENLSKPYKKSIVNLFKKPDFQGTYRYIIDSNEIGFENFDSIYKVEVVFDYEKDILEVDKEIPLDEEIINEGSKPSRGGGGGGSSFTPDSDLIPTLKAYWKYNDNEVIELRDIVYGTSLTLVLENSGLSPGESVEFIIYEKDWFEDDYMAKVNTLVGSKGYVSVDWVIEEAHVDAARSFLEGKLELYFEIRGIESGILKIGFVEEEPSVLVYAINLNGPQYTATDGTVFEADDASYRLSGPLTDSTTEEITNTQDDTLFQTQRLGRINDGSIDEPLEYAFPVSPGEYTVELYFSEIWWGTERSGFLTQDRMTNVYIEDVLVEQDFNIGQYILEGIKKTYTPITVSDTMLSLKLDHSVRSDPGIGAIKIIKVSDYLLPEANCSDEIQNQNETDVDCGGECDACFTGTIYYISNSGDDNTGDGSINNPWTSLSHACSQVTTFGDLIYVNSGTYYESQSCVLAEGVSIKGEGDSSHIISSYTVGVNAHRDASIVLASNTEGTNGDQSISFLKLDGNNLVATKAISVVGRNNVKIYNCTIVDFENGAVLFGRNVPEWTYPIIYLTGNEFYNNYVDDCSTLSATHGLGENGYQGQIDITGQDGLKIYNNKMFLTSRTDFGNHIDGVQGPVLPEGHNKGVKIFNNYFDKPENNGGNWNFHLELWDSAGGFEIYNNEFHGGDVGVDFGGHYAVKGDYDYSFWIHDNIFEQDQLYSFAEDNAGGFDKNAIDLEGNAEDVIINNNYFKNYPTGIVIILPSYVKAPFLSARMNIYNNVFENVGYSDQPYGSAIRLTVSDLSWNIEDINIFNNVIVSGNLNPAGQSWTGIWLVLNGDFKNINIKNNIIQGFYYGPILFDGLGGTIDNLHIENNLYNDNGNSNDITYWYDVFLTNFVNQNNIKANPGFVSSSDYHLVSTSPAIDAGINVGLPYLGNAPDIGAFESSYTAPEGDVADYYVATWGNDNNLGTFDEPFGTWEKLRDVLQPGDLAYIRGGTYVMPSGSGAKVHWTGFSGTANNLIKIWAYPGEEPILTIQNRDTGSSNTYLIRMENVDYVHVKGLRVTGADQTDLGTTGNYVVGVQLTDCNHILLEDMEADHIGGSGFPLYDSKYITFLNVDAHHLADPYSSDPNGGADGFGIWGTGATMDTSDNLRYINSRAWLASDDGWDFTNKEIYNATVTGSWSFWNGYLSDFSDGGDGRGYKFGGAPWDPGTTMSFTVTNNIAAENRDQGFDQNGMYGYGGYYYNNLGYNNVKRSFHFWDGEDYSVFKNNIAYADGLEPIFGDNMVDEYNSWNVATVDNNDFVSLDVTQLDNPRKADGSLPDITFGHLASGSDLINAGTNVGLEYQGSGPDIGAFEYSVSS